MSSAVDSIFPGVGSVAEGILNPGKAPKEAAKEQTKALNQAIQTQERATAEAKAEIRPAFDQARLATLQRAAQAADMLAGGFAPGLDVMQQGNLNAQQTIMGGGQNAMAAILGGQINPNAYAPQGIDFNPTDFLSSLQGLQQLRTEGKVTPEAQAADKLKTQQIFNDYFSPAALTRLVTGGPATPQFAYQQGPPMAAQGGNASVSNLLAPRTLLGRMF